MITFLFRKLTKVSKNNFNIDINGISDPLKVCKNITYAVILIYQPIRNFIPRSPHVHYTGLTLTVIRVDIRIWLAAREIG